MASETRLQSGLGSRRNSRSARFSTTISYFAAAIAPVSSQRHSVRSVQFVDPASRMLERHELQIAIAQRSQIRDIARVFGDLQQRSSAATSMIRRTGTPSSWIICRLRGGTFIAARFYYRGRMMPMKTPTDCNPWASFVLMRVLVASDRLRARRHLLRLLRRVLDRADVHEGLLRAGGPTCRRRFSSKLRIVSASGVNLPGLPVNTSATKNGCDRNRSMRGRGARSACPPRSVRRRPGSR